MFRNEKVFALAEQDGTEWVESASQIYLAAELPPMSEVALSCFKILQIADFQKLNFENELGGFKKLL